MTLHDLVKEAPQVLPLAGSPQVVVLGRELRLGSGSADRVAVEPLERPVLLEIKLARNAEARRAIVAQEMGLTPEEALWAAAWGGALALDESPTRAGWWRGRWPTWRCWTPHRTGTCPTVWGAAWCGRLSRTGRWSWDRR